MLQVETLDAPLFLIAMRQVVDPFFHRSVVLLLEHSEEGSFGLVLNRPLELKVGAVLGELAVQWHGDNDLVVHLGGPVQPNVGMTLFGERSYGDESREVAPGVHLATDTDTLKRIAAKPPQDFRFFVGYAGWGGGQLEQELGRNDWLLAPFNRDIVFSPHAEGVWATALASIGVRPEALAMFTHQGDEETGN